MKPQLTMTKGLPASGKSYWAKEQVNHSGGTIKRVNKDDLRAMIDDGNWSKDNEKFVLAVRDFIVNKALSSGISVIVDDTNFGRHEQDLRAIAEKNGADFLIEDFTNVPLSACLKRDQERAASVGKDVIMRMYNQYLKPQKKEVERFVFPDGAKPAIICDIDGTLAKMRNRGPFDWHLVMEDDIVKEVLEMLHKYHQGGHKVIIVSGRDAVCLPETERWLDKYGVPFDALFMRPEGNNEKDAVIKERIFRQNIAPHYNVKFILDDRDQVVEMWRSLGLKCFQVAEGSF